MKNVLGLMMFLVASTSVHVQTGVAQTATAQPAAAPTGIDGTWRFESGQDSWTAMLKAEGSKLTGTVTSCASNRGVIDVFEGRVDGTTITFKCKSLNGVRTLTFTGKVSGDEIAFAWEQAGAGGAGDAFIFGESAPKQFIVKRVIVVAWIGTIQNVNGEGVVNNQKNPVSIEIKQVSDPHWRWRDKGELTVTTLIAGGQGGANYELSTFLVTDQQLSYSFSRPQTDGKGDIVQCEMPRRADGAYEGDCKGGGFRRHVILNPPAPAAAK